MSRSEAASKIPRTNCAGADVSYPKFYSKTLSIGQLVRGATCGGGEIATED